MTTNGSIAALIVLEHEMYAIYSKHGLLLGRCDTFMEASWRLKQWSQAAYIVSAGWVAAVKRDFVLTESEEPNQEAELKEP